MEVRNKESSVNVTHLYTERNIIKRIYEKKAAEIFKASNMHLFF